MKIIPRASIQIPPQRQRRSLPLSHIVALRTSILSIGLLHPPVVVQKGEIFILVAGQCRLAAIDQIAADGLWFYCNLATITSGEVPVLELTSTMTQSEVKEAELHENTERAELPWPDRVSALAEIHSLRLQENPKQNVSETARELVESGTTTGSPLRPQKTFLSLHKAITEANIIAPHLSDPKIAKARNATEALHLVYEKEERAYAAELLKRTPQATIITFSVVRQGDALTVLPQLESGFVDLILADPPYAIGAGGAGFRSRTVHHHNYEDSPESARRLIQAIFIEGFRVAQNRANLFLFTDIDLFVWAKEVGKRAGWDVFRTPLTWVKSDSEGLAPWGRKGFRRTTEWILFARKGERGLYHAPVDVLRFNRVPRHERQYGPEKPIALLRSLIEAATMPGDLVLDPCCGSGSALVASRMSDRKSLGIEIDQDAFNLALVNANKDLTELSDQSFIQDLPEGESELESL